MRLLFCCEYYHPSRGGVQEVMRQIAERMVTAGHQVTVATSRLRERDFERLNGVEVREFRVSGNLAKGIRGEVDAYRRFVLAFGADAILVKAAQQWTFDALWPILDRIAARKVFVPCGFSALYEPAYAGYFAQLPDILRKFDHLIFYAEHYRDIDFARSHGMTHFSVVPNGASELEFGEEPSPGFRGRLGIGEEEFLFLTVGSPIGMKGHAQVAEAFARLDSKGRPTSLILNGSWRQSRRASGFGAVLAATRRVLLDEGISGLTKRVGRMLPPVWTVSRDSDAGETTAPTRGRIEHWIERARSQPGKKVFCTDLPRPELIEAFFAADLFVFASLIEYSPLVLFEAAAAGTPFLTVPVGNAEEIARWTGAGLTCPAEKDRQGLTRVAPDRLAQEMQRCMSAPHLLERLARTGRDIWRKRFSWAVIAPRYEQILRGDLHSADQIAAKEIHQSG